MLIGLDYDEAAKSTAQTEYTSRSRPVFQVTIMHALYSSVSVQVRPKLTKSKVDPGCIQQGAS